MKTTFSRFISLLGLTSLLAGSFLAKVSAVQAQSSREWADPINISNSSIALNPYIVIGRDGTIHAMWEDQIDDFRYSSSADGVNWSTPVKVRYPFAKGVAPARFLVDHEGLVNIFWLDEDNSLFHSRVLPDKVDKPYAWGGQYRLSRSVLNYDVHITAYGAMHVAYIAAGGQGGVFHRASLGGGRTWSEARLLYQSSYFRSLAGENAHVRVMVSDDPQDRKVNVLWDNRPQKRVFMAISPDFGETWSAANQIKGPEDAGGFGTPYNVEMSRFGQQELLMWQVGEPGANQCAVYAQWSSDGGETWREPDTVLDNRSICPQSMDVIVHNEEGSIVLLSNFGVPSLVAWDGEKWSGSQLQDEISLFSNPLTFDTILFGCQQHAVYAEKLFLIGCDLGRGGDIWLTSRSLSTWKNWFPPSSAWNLPQVLTNTSNKISFLSYAADVDSIHAVWVESPRSNLSSTETGGEAIVYARWTGTHWSSPQRVLTGLKSKPVQLSFVSNREDRLALVWVDENSGDLLFSWANSKRANSPFEWASPAILPSVSKLNSSPDVLIDSAGQIVVAYAVPSNENRGIYAVRSSDNGETWSQPFMIFDAVGAGWQLAGAPKISLGADGTLHVLFTQISILNGQAVGLYYAQSRDGGVKWVVSEPVSEESIFWSDLIAFGDSTVHRLWQQYDGSLVENFDQVSLDGGATWAEPVSMTPAAVEAIPVSLVFNGIDQLHFVQLKSENSPQYIKEYHFSIQDLLWDGEKWISQPFQELVVTGENASYAIVGGITLDGYMDIGVHSSFVDLKGEPVNEVVNMGRILGSSADQTPLSAILPPANFQPVPTVVAVTQPFVVGVQTPLPESLRDPTSSLSVRNWVGATLFVVVVLLITFFFLGRSMKRRP